MDRQQTGKINNFGSFGFYDAQHLQLLQGGTNCFDENPKSHVISSAETVPCAAGYKWLLSANDNSQPADCYNGCRWERGSVGEEMMCKGRCMETCAAAHELPLRELDIINNTAEGDMSSQNLYIGLMTAQRSNISDFFSAGNGASASNYISPLNLLHGAESSTGAGGFDNIACRNPNLHLGAQYWGNCYNSAEPHISWNQQDAPSLPATRSTLLINNQAGHDFRTSDAQSEGLPRIINTTVALPADHDQMRQTSRISSIDYSCSDTAGYSASCVGVLRSSKYLRAAQQILEEICNAKSCDNSMKRASSNQSAAIGVDQISDGPLHMKAGSASTGRINQMWMSGEERCNLQMKKARLIGMVEELDQRYQQYRDEMQLIVTSFESATGMGGAAPYTALAKKLISRQFRTLRDAIREHIHGACRMLGEDISSVPILNKGETPRLRILDQRLRHHRMLQQVGLLKQHYEGWRPQRGLPERCVAVLRAWLFEHFLHPYPKDSEKLMLARLTGLTRRQVANWFINARVRIWKPMVEKMYADERKEAKYRNQEGADRYGSSGCLKGATQRRSVMTKHGVSLTLALQHSSVVDQLEPNIYKPNQHYPVSEDVDYNIMS